MNIVLIGSAVRKLCQTNDFYRILNAIPGFETFGACDGGCLMVATALLQAGVPGTLYSLWGRRRKPIWPISNEMQGQYRPRWQHALLKVGPNSYLDGDGLKTESEVYKWWTVYFEITALRPAAPLHRIRQAQKDVPYDDRVVRNLADYFNVGLDRYGIRGILK